MSSNRYWQILIGLLTIITAWFAFSSLYLIYHYVRLSEHTMPTDIQWSVQEISDERFLLNGRYDFKVNDKNYSGETLITSPYYLNNWAAEQGINDFKNLKWKVWFASNNPEYSSLQKNFPFKEGLSTLLLAAVLAYFVGLKYYVEKNYDRNNIKK
jgi:hypothetical protein